MKLLVDRLTETPADYDFEVGAAWWRAHASAGTGLPQESAEPFHVHVRAWKQGEDVLLEGEIRGAFELECGRCLARYRQPLRESFRLVLEGEIQGAFELECSRCLARYRQPLRESFRLVLEPAGTRVPGDPEAAAALARDGLCLGDELETGWYRGAEVQLDAVCLELITLALPVQPICREDCAGLCPRCGVDRNTTACECEEVRPDSPFAALASLRGPRGER